MKLLFDQSLSHRLGDKLADLFPGSKHVGQVKLSTASDEAVWAYARQNDFVIVTKGLDFDGLSVLRGHPPGIIRLGCGNQSNDHIENVLRQNHSKIVSILKDPGIGFLEIT
jgi:predicted nuclease of predicted toxin-antitoxin system